MQSDSDSPPSPAGVLSNVLSYMHRRLSEIVAPDAAPAIRNALHDQDRDHDHDPGARPIPGSTPRIPDSNWLRQTDDQGTPNGVSRMTPLQSESPLHRAGFLQPKSYNASFSSASSLQAAAGDASRSPTPTAHTQGTIRLATMQLSNMPFLPGPPILLDDADDTATESTSTVTTPGAGGGGGGDFIFPHIPASEREPDSSNSPLTAVQNELSIALPDQRETLHPPGRGHGHLEEGEGASLLSHSTSSLPVSLLTTATATTGGSSTPPSPSSSSSSSLAPFQPSGLSLLRPFRASSAPRDETTPDSDPSTPKPLHSMPLPDALGFSGSGDVIHQAAARKSRVRFRDPSPLSLRHASSFTDETTPLLTTTTATTHSHTPPISYTQHQQPPIFPPTRKSLIPSSKWIKAKFTEAKQKVNEVEPFSLKHLHTAGRAVPAVLLGCLLNILDGVSYGMIIFPASVPFDLLGPMGVSMFFVTTILAQLVYTFGGSGFAGANGSMMIEVVPFFHILANSIAAEIGEENAAEVIATTLVAYAFSSVLTGLCFFLLGYLKLGVIVGFFPRHILVGCIGGVGAFLIQTGFAVSMRIDDDDLTPTLDTLRMMFLDEHKLVLWAIPLLLAVLLRVITSRWHHQLIFPGYFFAIPVIFYIVVAAAGLNLSDIRSAGWIFDIGNGEKESWYKFYSYLDFKAVRFGPLWSTLPTQFALLFFNILHPPLNVPALAVSLNTDVDTNKELVAHGYSNLLAGLFGTVPNYLVYVNTLLFYRVGGDNRISGFMLAIATAILLFIGTGPIAYIPVMVVGSLIFVLGIDLVKEALWDTRHRVSKTEYITIVSIMVCMTVWDFVIGVLFGIVVSCFFFVVQNSQLRSIRAIYTGDTAMSAVRRPSAQRAYIREVAKQTTILRLQGFLFFGTITYVEETIRDLVEGPSWNRNPVRFLVLDLSLVAGVDMSSAEALVRVQRLLAAKNVTLVFCGFTADSAVGKALRSVDILGSEGVELFSTFSDAMEWTENAYLRAWFRSQKIEISSNALTVPGRQDADIDYSRIAGSFVRSPRRSHMRDVASRTIAHEIEPQHAISHNTEPLNTLSKALSSYGEIDKETFRPIEQYFEKLAIPAGFVLWKHGDPSDGLYIIESGILRATYEFASGHSRIEESMVPCTIAGELSALSDSPRNATVVAEHASVLWKLSIDNLKKIQDAEPELSRIFIQLVLKAAKIDYDILLSSMASRQ